MAQYYMLKNMSELPAAAKLMFEEAKMSGNRKEQTRIVNSIMKKNKNGVYAVDLSAPIFEELRVKYERKYASERNRGVCKSIALKKVGGAGQLAEAIEEGDVEVSKGDDGRTYYVFRELETGKETGSHCKRGTSSKHVLTDEAASKMNDMLDSLDWKFAYTPKEQKISSGGGCLPEAAIEKLTLAINSVNKLIKGMSGGIVAMKPYLANSLVKQSFEKISQHITKYRSQVSTMENIKLLSVMDNGEQADCKKVLEILGTVARDMDVGFGDLQASAGLLSGVKKS